MLNTYTLTHEFNISFYFKFTYKMFLMKLEVCYASWHRDIFLVQAYRGQGQLKMYSNLIMQPKRSFGVNLGLSIMLAHQTKSMKMHEAKRHDQSFKKYSKWNSIQSHNKTDSFCFYHVSYFLSRRLHSAVDVACATGQK